MNKWDWRKSIRANIIWSAVIITTMVLIISAFYYIYLSVQSNELVEQRQALTEKAERKNDVERSLNDVFFRVRAFYAFQEDTDLDLLYQNLTNLKADLNALSEQELTAEETAFKEELTAFITRYETESLPFAINLVRNNNYEALRDYGNEGTNDAVNSFIEQARGLQAQTIEERDELFNNSIAQANQNTILAIAIGGILVSLLIYVVLRVLKNIIKPLESLTIASNTLSEGRGLNYQASNREDEIGLLERSFQQMANNLQEKEEMLTAQNEELQAQQQELHENQSTLEGFLLETKASNDRLNKYNELNHAMSMSLNKQTFISSIYNHLKTIYAFDRSVLALVDEEIYESSGFSENRLVDFLQSDKRDLIAQLKERNHVLVKRKATESEQGIASGEVFAYDFYSGVMDANREVLAIFAATRTGEAFSEDEMSEIDGTMNRVSLALERTVIYEMMQDSRQINQDILDNVNEGIMFVSKDKSILQMNEAIRTMIGNPMLKEDENWMVEFVTHVEEKAALQSFFNEALSSAKDDVLNYHYKVYKEETLHVIEVYSTAVYNNGEIIGTLFVHRDITREHELDAMKSDLVSTVSHELRTPLSSVLGFTELLLNKTLKAERQTKYLNTIHKEAKRLTNLINDFLDLQRMESGKQSYDKAICSMDTIVMDVVTSFNHIKSHHISFCDESQHVSVYADSARLQQVLTNLVSNAIKFSPDGGKVTITLKNEKQDVVVHVRDEGLGISDNHVDKLFSKFQRIDQSDRKKIGGTGLGLAITKEIVEKHDGSIWVNSVEGEGSVFSFKLPLYKIGTSSQYSSVSVGDNQDTVMIVEDDTSLALLLSEELKAHGFRVIHFSNPRHALANIHDVSLSAIVVDILLGDAQMNGWDLVEKLKEDTNLHEIPIVISSSMDRSDEKIEAFNIQNYLLKPYPPNELSKTILKVIHSSGAKQSGTVLVPKEM